MSEATAIADMQSPDELTFVICYPDCSRPVCDCVLVPCVCVAVSRLPPVFLNRTLVVYNCTGRHPVKRDGIGVDRITLVRA